MLKRDFNNESIINFFFRMVRAVTGRLRGRLFTLLNLFSSESSYKICIARGYRFLNSKSITFGRNVHVGVNVRLECYQSGKILFGDGSSLGDYVHIGAMNTINIGQNVLIGSNVLIIDHNHGNANTDLQNSNPKERTLTSKGSIVIGKNVWIADNVVILSGVTIGDGAIIAASTVVNRDIEKFKIYKGLKK